MPQFPLKTILVIDDSVDNQLLLKTIFAAKGYEVLCASDGREALSLLLELSILPNLILLDAQMPGMDGYAFRVEQQRTPRIRHIPVVVMTADDSALVAHDMLEPQGVLLKPFQLESVVESVSEFI